MPPRSAYIHVPFCAHRCGYCNFTLVTGRDDLIADYLRSIERELEGLGEPHEVDTLYFGGGTPTHLPPASLDRLLSLVKRWFPPAPGYELSVEANPADVTAERVAVLAAHGVTRVTLGAQSFRTEKLRLLERDHDGDDIRRAFDLCRRFPSVGLDLIFAAPGETLAQWQADLSAALALRPDHVSTYGLTIEKGTTFYGRWQRGGLQKADEELERAMYAMAIDRLTAAGLEHYEVSNFDRPGHRCRHNDVYWMGGQYFGIGPGAARHIDGRREINHRSTTTYLQRVLSGQSPTAESEQLSPADAAREVFVFAMRRLDGVSRRWFKEQTGLDLDILVGKPLLRFTELKLLTDDGETVRLTREGLFLSDSLWPEFLADG